MTVYGTRNSVLVGATILPGLGRVPRDASPELKRYLEALQETIEVRNGQRGDPRDRAVTLRELIDSGLAKELESTPFDPNNPTVDNIGFGNPTVVPNLNTPTAPTNFVVTSGYANISLKWDFPFTYQGHSFTEVWRHTSNDLTAASFVGTSSGSTFVDPVGSVAGTTFYYWVRHVNAGGEIGPFNASSGTQGSTATDVNVLLTSLTSQITSSQLTQTLLAEIPGQTLANGQSTVSIGTLSNQYTVKIATGAEDGQYVSGFGLSNVTNNGTTTSAFIVAANRFAIIDPDTYEGVGDGSLANGNPASGIVPFAVTSAYTDSTTGLVIPAGVYMNTAFINKATVSILLAGSIVGDFIKASVVMDAPHLHAGTINIGSISKTDANNPRTWTHGGTNRVGPFSVDANGLMHAKYGELRGMRIVAADGATELFRAGGASYGTGGSLINNGDFSAEQVIADNTAGNDTLTTVLGAGWTRTPDAVVGSGGSTFSDGSVEMAAGAHIDSEFFPVTAGENLYFELQGTSLTQAKCGAAIIGYQSNRSTFVASNFALNTDWEVNASGTSAVSVQSVPSNVRYAKFRVKNNLSSGNVTYTNAYIGKAPRQISEGTVSTFIRDATVNTLQVKGNAITVPVTSQWGAVPFDAAGTSNPTGAYAASELCNTTWRVVGPAYTHPNFSSPFPTAVTCIANLNFLVCNNGSNTDLWLGIHRSTSTYSEGDSIGVSTITPTPGTYVIIDGDNNISTNGALQFQFGTPTANDKYYVVWRQTSISNTSRWRRGTGGLSILATKR